MWRPPGGLLGGGTGHKDRTVVQLLLPLPGQPLKRAGLPLNLSHSFIQAAWRVGKPCFSMLPCPSPLPQASDHWGLVYVLAGRPSLLDSNKTQ